MPTKPYDVPATGVVDYQMFVVDPGWKEDKWISAIEPRPGNPAVVHHILMFVLPPDGKHQRRASAAATIFWARLLRACVPSRCPTAWPASCRPARS